MLTLIMRKLLLFLVVAAAFYCCSEFMERQPHNPQVVTEGIIVQKSFDIGRDSFYAAVGQKMYPVVRVLSDQGAWAYPKKDSVVTGFFTEKNPTIRFMFGKVGAAEIEKAFQKQASHALGVLLLLSLLIICCWNSDGEDDDFPEIKKS